MSTISHPATDYDRIINRAIEDEVREAFIDYSMSVIISRALPDARDGLKPVHRRILYAMHELGLRPNRPHKKSATVVGEVLGKYHPHGDAAVYDALVRMVQDFSLRYPLINGQGNFGSIDGDSAAAFRYTEARLDHAALELLADIDKNTVDFVPNFDDQLKEPVVLPSRFPNLLVNGTTGIAVGMATNIPPHNLREVVDACVYLLDHPDCSIEDLMRYVRGPDFPTGGVIHGLDGIREAYETGRGRVVIRGRAEIEEREDGRGERIVIRDVPYMVNKAKLVEQIAQLVNEKKLEDIADLRDESNRDGIRIVVDLKRDAIPQFVLNQLYKYTQLQTTFSITMLALVNKEPRVLNLKQTLEAFLQHRHEVVVRRTEHELAEARGREHILEGLKIAVDHIDEVIEIIRTSSTSDEASQRLMDRFALSETQANAILDIRLAKLTSLERQAIETQLAETRAFIADHEDILARHERRIQIIKDELREVADRFGDERRTDIIAADGDLSIEDLVPDEEMVITVTHEGYIKRTPANTYRMQRRGGRGINGMETKEEDWVEHLFLARTHDTLLFFTRDGRCYRLKVHEIPLGTRQSRGKPLVNLIQLGSGEKIAALVPVRTFDDGQNLVLATRKGIVKKTPLLAYENVRANGLIAMTLTPGDEIIGARITYGQDEIILATRNGIAIRFRETDIRETGRATMGVRGIRLASNDEIIGMVVPRPGDTLLVVTENGLGKRTQVDAYRLQTRGGLGVINVRTSEKTGRVVAIMNVCDEDELILVTRNGIINRQSVAGVPIFRRNTQGVRLINLSPNDSVTDVALVRCSDDANTPSTEQLNTSPAEISVSESAAAA